MLPGGDDDTTPGKTAQRHVVGFRPAGGEDHGAAPRADEIGDRRSGLFDDAPGLAAKSVDR